MQLVSGKRLRTRLRKPNTPPRRPSITLALRDQAGNYLDHGELLRTAGPGCREEYYLRIEADRLLMTREVDGKPSTRELTGPFYLTVSLSPDTEPRS